MAVTDLTGTTWTLNDTITFSSSLGLSNIISFNFTSNNTSFYGFYFDFNSDGDNSLGYRTNQAYSYVEIYNSSGNIVAGKEVYKTVTITGGTDATNSALISWLEANATQQSIVSRKSIDLTTLAGWESLSDGDHTITVVAKADGYRDSEPSAAVSVTKGSAIISFTIEGTSYQAEEGMTWGQWVNSSYNTGYQGGGEYLWSCTSSGYIKLDVMYVTTAGTLATRVKTTDIIVKDQSYPVYYD